MRFDPIGALLRGDPADEDQIIGLGDDGNVRFVLREVEPVVTRRYPIQVERGYWKALRVADRRQRGVRVVRENSVDDVEIETPVHRDESWGLRQTHEGECPDVSVRVDHVEFIGSLIDVSEHLQVQVRRDLLEFCTCHRHTKGFGAARHEFRIGARLTSGEQRHVMPAPNEVVGEGADDTFSPSVHQRWYGLIERGDEGDTHVNSLLGYSPRRPLQKRCAWYGDRCRRQ